MKSDECFIRRNPSVWLVYTETFSLKDYDLQTLLSGVTAVNSLIRLIQKLNLWQRWSIYSMCHQHLVSKETWNSVLKLFWVVDKWKKINFIGLNFCQKEPLIIVYFTCNFTFCILKNICKPIGILSIMKLI